jgi:membrane associated rhomboid family serine protease
MWLLPTEWGYLLLNRYGMVPMRYLHGAITYNGLPFDYYFSFVSNLFLHASWTHLLGNMWFMWIFADNVEDRMGSLRFLLFYLLCGICATILQWYANPHLAIPVVGASGAIAGVLAAYFFLYPLERVVLWFPPMFLFHTPAIAFLGVWVIWQLNDATTSLLFPNTPVDTAWWAHLGGFIAGFMLHPFFLRKDRAV